MTSTPTYTWHEGDTTHELALSWVAGTDGTPFLFGADPQRKPVNVGGFWIGSTQVTQALWLHVMGANPAKNPGPKHPIENVTWTEINAPGGFLERLNLTVLPKIAAGDVTLRFRLPSETEWEYAARGGPSWRDDFRWSGSNDPDQVAWFGPRWSAAHDFVARMAGWRIAWRGTNALNKLGPRRASNTHEVALKAPNQIGTHDMSGNVWEWCQDTCTDYLSALPADGSPYLGPGDGRRLRGGCHHNWDMHCQVFWRYGITPEAHDDCIGLRVVLADH